jgi:hypothetical protein
MKKTIIKYLAIIIVTATVYACTKNDGVTNQPYASYGTDSTGQLKINLAFAYTIDYATILIKVNGAVVSNSLQSRTPFPGGGYNTRGSNFALYLTVPKGNNTISVILPKAGTITDSIVLYSGSVTLPDNAPYTLHITDTAANVKTVFTKNIISKVDSGYCRFKFVNLIPNLTAVDLYLDSVLIKSNIPYLGITDTFTIAVGVNAPNVLRFPTPTWAITAAGTPYTTNAASRAFYASANLLQNQAVITLYSMGYNLSTGTRLPYICGTLDKNQ